jgi:hypothetical protein
MKGITGWRLDSDFTAKRFYQGASSFRSTVAAVGVWLPIH